MGNSLAEHLAREAASEASIRQVDANDPLMRTEKGIPSPASNPNHRTYTTPAPEMADVRRAATGNVPVE